MSGTYHLGLKSNRELASDTLKPQPKRRCKQFRPKPPSDRLHFYLLRSLITILDNPQHLHHRLNQTFANMSEAYERERQNNARLEELSAKVSSLRGVTVDIYDHARAHEVIDNTSDTFSSMSTQLKGSAGRLGRMAASGNKVAIFKLSAIIIGTILVLYYGWKILF